MSFQDKSVTCSDCGVTFTFSAGEQEFFQTKGFTSEPRRCPACRQAKRSQQGGNGDSATPRRLYPATCSACGTETTLPFEPRGDRPVYCRDCFSRVSPR